MRKEAKINNKVLNFNRREGKVGPYVKIKGNNQKSKQAKVQDGMNKYCNPAGVHVSELAKSRS